MGRNYFRDAVDFTRSALRKHRLEEIEQQQRREEALALRFTRVRTTYCTHRRSATRAHVWSSDHRTNSTPFKSPSRPSRSNLATSTGRSGQSPSLGHVPKCVHHLVLPITRSDARGLTANPHECHPREGPNGRIHATTLE